MTTGAVFRSEGFYEMLGCESGDFEGRVGDWYHLVVPEDYAAVQMRLAEYLEGKLERNEIEFRVRKPSGDVIWIQSRGQVVARDELGKPLRMVGTHTDVTDRKKLEVALQESENRFRSIFKNHDAIMLLIEPETGQIIDANRSAVRFYGYDLPELLEMRM